MIATSRMVVSWLCAVVVLTGAPGCQTGTESDSRKLLGGVEVRAGETAGRLPQQAPQRIYVAEFALDAENYAGEEGIRGALPGRLGQRGPRLPTRNTPAEAARQIVETMAESLVHDLAAKGLTAQRLDDASAGLPREGWLVQGVFTEVDEGDRMKRALIGFGRGSTTMELQVGISDLAGPDPRAAFALFGTVKDASKIPGAVVTLNPYVAAARFVLQKNATERDIQQTARQIAEEIVKLEQQVRKGAKPDR